jgi:hypothetical protein
MIAMNGMDMIVYWKEIVQTTAIAMIANTVVIVLVMMIATGGKNVVTANAVNIAVTATANMNAAMNMTALDVNIVFPGTV